MELATDTDIPLVEAVDPPEMDGTAPAAETHMEAVDSPEMAGTAPAAETHMPNHLNSQDAAQLSTVTARSVAVDGGRHQEETRDPNTGGGKSSTKRDGAAFENVDALKRIKKHTAEKESVTEQESAKTDSCDLCRKMYKAGKASRDGCKGSSCKL